jgi:hypothetical protein
MRAAYGTFLEALLVIYGHDVVADAAASEFNVSWVRTTPIVVSGIDDAYRSYITGEMDHRMGMDVVGDPDNVRAFRYACSSAFSPIEYWVNEVLFPSNSTSSLMGSVTMGLGVMLLDGGSLEIFESSGYIIIRAVGDNQRLLIIDPVTGIVRDGMTLNETISGNYCFSDLQTEWTTDFTENILNYGQNISNILINGNGFINLSPLSVNTKNGIIGFLSSAMMSLGSASMYFANNIPYNSFSTLLGLNMVGLACFNAYAGRYINEIVEGTNVDANERRTYVIVNAATHPVEKYYEQMGEPIGEVRERQVVGLTFSEMTPEQQAHARKQIQQSRTFLKGVFLTSVGVVMFVGPIFVPFLASIGPFTSAGGPIVIHSGVHLMADGTDYI